MSSPLGRPPVTGKSFRFVRACDARCLDVKGNPDAKKVAGPFSLFPFGPVRAFKFRLGSQKSFPAPFPFSLFPISLFPWEIRWEIKGVQVRSSESK